MWNRVIVNSVLRDKAQKLCGVVAVRASSSVQQPPKLESILAPVEKKNMKEQKISRAMRAYLERAQKHDVFLAEQREEFELGKRHLANIMGWNPDNISQEEVDEAIAYLLPSGLFEPKARPMMKPPETIFPKEKEAEFDHTGRPFNFLFYTTKGRFYNHLHDAYLLISKLNDIQTRMRMKGVRIPEASEKFDMSMFYWITKEDLISMTLERIRDDDYSYFLRTMERLADHPYSNSAKEFLIKFLKQKVVGHAELEIPPLMHDEDGNPYMEARSHRKTARAIVRVTGNGTGNVIINKSRSVEEYFPTLKDRIQIMYPMQFTGLLNKVDVEATVFFRRDDYEIGELAKLTSEEQEELIRPLDLHKGQSCEAGAMRHAISKALCSFVTRQDVQAMKLAGLLTRDLRSREKKKSGKRGARRRFPWRKR